ncbi:MAG: DUF3332 domain-containing protein [Paludibacteraceae bacterium]|nr:DUF3332 domain-containing protein [Paludibacteraceae bacterium]MCR4619231.1 DUF3332 domain-containing protein [Paludibacteraceae bacterium]
MKKLIFGVSALLASSIMFSSCIGSFALFNKLLDWNQGLGNKVVNEVVYLAFNIIPVYGIAMFVDGVVLNTIEFWTGSNPMGSTVKTVEDENGTFRIASHDNGYTITKEGQEGQLDLTYNAEENAWYANDVKFMTFVDENHVQMYGSDAVIELSQAGLAAYRALANGNAIAFAE